MRMAYTLATAAAAVGRNRSSISRAIKTGKLSATRDEVTGAWIIDPAELHRLYPPISAQPDAQHDARPDAEARMGDAHADVHALLRRAEVAESRLADAQDQIADLRRRLDAADEERRAVLRPLTALLIDQRNGAAKADAGEGATQAAGRRRWWPLGRQSRP
jgi:hypothetical protein